MTRQNMSVVSELLMPLDRQFRNDLGLVCASHHLDDLHDLPIPVPAVPTGGRAGGLQPPLLRIVLRASDLLHITSDRTPSVMFKVINPTDPVSQIEWAKQRAVRRVCPKIVPPGDHPTSEGSGAAIRSSRLLYRSQGFLRAHVIPPLRASPNLTNASTGQKQRGPARGRFTDSRGGP